MGQDLGFGRLPQLGDREAAAFVEATVASHDLAGASDLLERQRVERVAGAGRFGEWRVFVVRSA